MKTGDIFSIEKSLYVRRCGIGRIELRKRGRYGEDSLLQWMFVYGCKGTEMLGIWILWKFPKMSL